ncbi:hypothetical protein Hanom_Chr06g00557621 [Helianthus anomalus]
MLFQLIHLILLQPLLNFTISKTKFAIHLVVLCTCKINHLVFFFFERRLRATRSVTESRPPKVINTRPTRVEPPTSTLPQL